MEAECDMGTFSKLQNKKLDPWFCIVCNLVDGTVKLPREIYDDPYPDIQRSSMLFIDSDSSARLFVRSPTAMGAKAASRRYMKNFMADREIKAKKTAV